MIAVTVGEVFVSMLLDEIERRGYEKRCIRRLSNGVELRDDANEKGENFIFTCTNALQGMPNDEVALLGFLMIVEPL